MLRGGSYSGSGFGPCRGRWQVPISSSQLHLPGVPAALWASASASVKGDPSHVLRKTGVGEPHWVGAKSLGTQRASPAQRQGPVHLTVTATCHPASHPGVWSVSFAFFFHQGPDILTVSSVFLEGELSPQPRLSTVPASRCTQ